MNSQFIILEDEKSKRFCSKHYNYYFNKSNGFFARWGKTENDDPDWSPFGNEILDLEISTGECLGRCKFCYKENGTPKNPTRHMSLDTFKDIMNRMAVAITITLDSGETRQLLPTNKLTTIDGNVVLANQLQIRQEVLIDDDKYHKITNVKHHYVLTQIALGLTNTTANPDFWNIIEECRSRGIIPNYTTHGLDITPEIAQRTAGLCGAVAVSVVNKEKTYNTVKMFTDAGMTQVNIHYMLSAERIESAIKLVDDIKNDPRLAKLNAVVFLQYKPKGSCPDSFTIPALEDFRRLVEYCDNNGIRYGFDSCTAPMYLKVIQGKKNEPQLAQYVEPCESGLFSSYIGVDGTFYACSFCEGVGGWKKGMCITDYDCFADLWKSPKLDNWRQTLLKNERACPMYNLGDGQSSDKLFI
jgi:MoaA/NifB/PqqE/SkfB family radical SAM enzyme